MEFFEQGVCTSLESFPSVRQMKKEQSMIVRGKILEGRDVYAELPTGFGPNFCLAFVKLLEGLAKIRSQNFFWCSPHVRLSPI